MARFKKKRSKPTPETKPEKPEEAEEEPTGNVPDSSPEIPPDGRPETGPAEDPLAGFLGKDENGRKLNFLFWLRVALAVGAGAAATFIFEPFEGEERRWASILFMIIVFAATIPVAKGMKMQLPSSDRKKIVTQAIGSYVFLYLFVWIVTYTFANTGDVSGGINI